MIWRRSILLRIPIARGLAGDTIEMEVFGIELGDHHAYVRMSTSALKNSDAPVTLVASMDDVTTEFTQRREAERSNRLDALGHFTGGIAHDFNNILGAVLPSVQLALHFSEDPFVKRQLETALAAVRKGADLSGRLLTFASQQPENEKNIDVVEALTEIIKIAMRTVEADVNLELVTEGRDLIAFCDRVQLENVVLNLIINAHDAIRRSGTGENIFVKACHARNPAGGEEWVAISVVDDGPGMSEDVKSRPPIRSLRPRSRPSGTGLGLSMAFGFARQVGGLLEITSTLGNGTTVAVKIPKGSGEMETEKTNDDWISGEGRRILVVDDESALGISIGDVLSTLGYDVKIVRSSEEALGLLEDDDDFDLLLTDIIMPGSKNGFQLAQDVNDRWPDIRIVYTSGYTGFEKDVRMTVRGPLIQKPCDIAQLSRTLNGALV